MKNQVGDKCFADTMTVLANTTELVNGKVNIKLIAEVDGILFESNEYDSYKEWLQDIIQRVYSCAMGELN